MVIGEMTRLRRLSERLLVIAASEDPDFLRSEPVALDEFALEVIERWQSTAQRRWKLGRLDQATVLADPERLGLAVDALLENAVKFTSADEVIELSVVSVVGRRGPARSKRHRQRDARGGSPARLRPVPRRKRRPRAPGEPGSDSPSCVRWRERTADPLRCAAPSARAATSRSCSRRG